MKGKARTQARSVNFIPSTDNNVLSRISESLVTTVPRRSPRNHQRTGVTPKHIRSGDSTPRRKLVEVKTTNFLLLFLSKISR